MIRVLWLGATLLCAGMSVFVLRGLVGEIYLVAGSDEHQQLPSGDLSGQALEVATRASPWMSEIWLHRAYRAASRGDRPQMLAFSREALRWAPADARLWMSHAQLLVFAGVMGKELEHALLRVREQAPASPHLHLNKALLGIQVWRDAPDFLRRDALASARFMLQHRPRSFHRGLTDQRLEFLACTFAGAELKLSPWCALIQRERQRCDKPNPEPAVLARCQTMGLR